MLFVRLIGGYNTLDQKKIEEQTKILSAVAKRSYKGNKKWRQWMINLLKLRRNLFQILIFFRRIRYQ